MTSSNENKLNKLEVRVLHLEAIITKLIDENYRCNEVINSNNKDQK